MIRLHPIPEVEFYCPHDNQLLQILGWYIPGMRNLASLHCPKCGREYYGDLPSGQGLYTPLLIDKKTEFVYDPYKISFFSSWLRDSYNARRYFSVSFSEIQFRPIIKPILLNCLDTLYGHCLLKLLNAQYYIDHKPDFDLILVIPKNLQWMIPEGTAAVWIVDIPLKNGICWNDWLATEFHKRINKYNECWLSIAYSHPHPRFFSIERFTKVLPFPTEKWYEKLKKPAITFVWREDRLWNGNNVETKYFKIFREKTNNLTFQRTNVIDLATQLQASFSNINFAVVGIGGFGNFPNWISDLRVHNIDDNIERKWCERFASSHIVIGIHGSNMLIPSAHAGVTIELMPLTRWGNILQDLLMADMDPREAIFRHYIIPDSTTSNELSGIIISILQNYGFFELNMNLENTSHISEKNKVLRIQRLLLSN